MHRSALNAEVQYKLKMQELECHCTRVVEKETSQPGFVSRLLGFLQREPRGDAQPSSRRGSHDVRKRFAEKSASR